MVLRDVLYMGCILVSFRRPRLACSLLIGKLLVRASLASCPSIPCFLPLFFSLLSAFLRRRNL